MRGVAKQVAVRARRLIEKGWCRDEWARTAEGGGCPYSSSAARSFCALGAIYRAAIDVGAELPPNPFWTEWAGTLPSSFEFAGDANWNDARSTSKQDVLERFDRVIEALSAEERGAA